MRAGLVGLCALCLPVGAQGADVVRRAIVVGANDGGAYFEPLRYAERDAERMSDVLIDLADFAAYDVDYLATPSADELDDAFRAAAAATYGVSDTLFLFYYSGHADEQGLHIAGAVYPWDRLKAAVRDVPAEVHLGILDACRSGTVTRIKGASVSAPFLPTTRLDAEGEAWISSAADDEEAQESDQLRGSFFTYYLVSGLRGAADDGADGYVSLNEAYTYAYDRTVAHTSGIGAGTQHPRYAFDIQGNGDLRLTSVGKASATIAFPQDTHGEVVVLSLPDETPVGELSLDGEREVVLAVRPGDYRLRRRYLGVLSETHLTVRSEGRAVADAWGDGVVEATLAKGAHPPTGFPTRPRARRVNLSWLRQNKGIAAVFSTLIPGTGQMYAGRWVSGSLFLSGVLVSNGVGWGAAVAEPSSLTTGAVTGPNFGTLAGVMLYTWNIADAVYRTGKQRPFGPRSGIAISLGSAWSGDAARPHASGLSFELHPLPELSIGLDRVGFLYDNALEVVTVNLAVRVTAGPSGPRWHPAGFMSVGARYHYDVSATSTDAVNDPSMGTAVIGFGGLLRWQATPTYFVSTDLRGEWTSSPGALRFVIGGELGLMIGRRNQSRPAPIEDVPIDDAPIDENE